MLSTSSLRLMFFFFFVGVGVEEKMSSCCRKVVGNFCYMFHVLSWSYHLRLFCTFFQVYNFLSFFYHYRVIFMTSRSFGCHTPLNKLVAEMNNTANFTVDLTTQTTLDYDMKKFSFEVDHLKKDRVDILNLK